jgi:hypothetical protein
MRWALLCAVLCSCGLQPLELAPHADTTTAIVVGTPSQDAIAKLTNAEPELAPAARLLFLQPAVALAVPDNVAPLSFGWYAEGTMPAPPMAAMSMPMMSPGKAAPPLPTGAAQAYALFMRDDAGALLQALYTDRAHARFPEDRWRAALASQAGRTLQLELRALFASGEVLKTAPLVISVRGPVPTGALYAFSTTAQGLMRASIEQDRGSYLDAAPSEGKRCQGCHAVSRDGRKLLAAVSGEASLSLIDLDTRSALPLALPAAPASNEDAFASFDLAGTRVAIASGGGLFIVDASSGSTLRSMSWPGMSVSQPDWSPDGSFIALSVAAAPGAKPDMKGKAAATDIARVAIGADSELGALEMLVSDGMPKDAARRYPSYSPDGSLIAFEQRMGPMADPDMASLFVVPSAGGSAIKLLQASAYEMPGNANGWPSWMPGDRRERPFLVFASSRAAFGGTLPVGRRQLFAAEIDLTKAAAGDDPSAGAFWLPFQEDTGSYRHAVWAQTSNSCVAQTELCDGRDDDCDDRVDEECCSPQPEGCGDGQDDDCDGVSDEGCDCGDRDVCDDGVDNDCDGSVDEQPCTRKAP